MWAPKSNGIPRIRKADSTTFWREGIKVRRSLDTLFKISRAADVQISSNIIFQLLT